MKHGQGMPTGWTTGWTREYGPAGNGTEVPFPRNGRWYLRIWDAVNQQHLIYCFETDISTLESDWHVD